MFTVAVAYYSFVLCFANASQSQESKCDFVFEWHHILNILFLNMN